ncbi:MAG: InlB B-repeat-containing protein, partial [Lachnospiraceae bacterium]|nr:InlB B-repeat-containing protein [Lachnospiraceae bacterium]
KEGYTFKGWQPDYHDITANLVVIAQYSDNSGSANRHTVTFYADDGKTVVSRQEVDHNGSAVAPMPPSKTGYTFVAWAGNYTDVTKDESVVASYTPNTTTSPGPGSSSRPGASASPTATPANGENEVRKYRVTVSGGSGTGDYPAGAVVAINAYDMGVGQNFDKWTTSTAGVGFADATARSTTFTMPASNVSITATYKIGSSGGSGSGSGSGSGAGSGSGTTGRTSNSGTIVDISRPGISNTNLAGATVSGATDNFIVKITEDQAATDAATAALQARYGDLSRIKYLPMDISLYDSTGRIKIADTTGISVNLTLPLPDDLVQYAGNNRVAAITNGQLEDLNMSFTTIDGVPCVNFTATHFSPYVIYVDTANLTEATIDSTPKTGDPIHPKWFLALGLACTSLILFFKRDKVVLNTKNA